MKHERLNIPEQVADLLKGLVFDGEDLNLQRVIYYSMVLLGAFAGLILLLFCPLLGYNAFINGFAAVVTVLISGYLCYLYRHNLPWFIILLMIAYCNYSIAVGVYLDPSIRPANLYVQFSGYETLGIAILDVLIFVETLLLFARKHVGKEKTISSHLPGATKNRRYDPLIAIGGIGLYLLIFFASFRFGEGGTRGSSSALNEYRVLILLAGSFYCGNRKLYKWLWTVVVAVTSVLVFLSGNRIDAFGSAFALVIIWYSDFVDYKKILILLPIGLIGMVMIGVVRGGAITAETIGRSFQALWKSKLTFDTPIYAYVPTLCMIELSKRLPFAEKVSLLWRHIVYAFTPWASGASSPDLSTFSVKYYAHSYGFLSTGYFYVWFWHLGSALLAALVQLYQKFQVQYLRKKAKTYFDQLKLILSWYCTANVARWYIYGPMGLIRGMFVCGICFTIVFFANMLLRKYVPVLIQRLSKMR